MTRDEILDAAAQIFREKGYYATSMQDIARAVNLQKASLYHHVTGKQEILLALLDRALNLLIETVQPLAESTLPPQQKLEKMVAAYLDALIENGDLAAVLLLEHRSLKPELHRRHVPFRDRFENLWRSVLYEGVEQGVFVCEDVHTLTRVLLGAMNWTITWYRPRGRLSVAEIAAHISHVFLHGLLADQPGPQVPKGRHEAARRP